LPSRRCTAAVRVKFGATPQNKHKSSPGGKSCAY
jgi:hypothetical protein